MTTKEVLAVVVEHLNNASCEDARDLWNVLTALRGPDDGDEKLKWETTAVIRGAVGLDGSRADKSHRLAGGAFVLTGGTKAEGPQANQGSCRRQKGAVHCV